MRRRIAAAAGALLLCGGTAALVIHLRRTVVPPGCADPRTLALVHRSLVSHFGLPHEVRIENAQTVAGGPLAFRFVCQADIAGVEPARLPANARAGFVRYTSRLTEGGTRQNVTVEVLPLLLWEKVW